MSIFSDIVDNLDKLSKLKPTLLQRKDKIGDDLDSDEARFFARPMASVARSAKKSILYFPVVTSEAISPETAAALAKMVQVRAAEYVRLMVTNHESITAENGGRTALVGRLRGATLGSDALGIKTDTFREQVQDYLRKNAESLVEAELASERLRSPLETHEPSLLDEARQVRNLDVYNRARHIANAPKEQRNDGDVKGGQKPSNNATGKHADDALDFEDAPAAPPTPQLPPAGGGGSQPPGGNGGGGQPPDGGTLAQLDASSKGKQLSPEEQRNIADTRDAFQKNQRARLIMNASKVLRDNNGELIKDLLKNPDFRALFDHLKSQPPEVIEELCRQELHMEYSGWKNVTDVDKVNRFPPVMLELTIRNKVGERQYDERLLVGVKAMLHSVPSADVVTGVGPSQQRDSLFLQFLRLTSGEISFVKDFILNVRVAKIRASTKTSSGIKVLETMRRQAEWNDRKETFIYQALSKRGFIPPTATLLVTADECDRIKSLYGVDLSKPSSARELLKSHNLMGFAIVDEAIGLVRFFEDGDDDFDRVPMTEIKARGKETSVKDIMTILARN